MVLRKLQLKHFKRAGARYARLRRNAETHTRKEEGLTLPGRTSFVVYTNYRALVEKMPNAARGRLFLALINYVENGTTPQLGGRADMVFSFMREQLDRDDKKFRQTCERNRTNIRKRWGKHSAEYDRIPEGSVYTENENEKEYEKENEQEQEHEKERENSTDFSTGNSTDFSTGRWWADNTQLSPRMKAWLDKHHRNGTLPPASPAFDTYDGF